MRAVLQGDVRVFRIRPIALAKGFDFSRCKAAGASVCPRVQRSGNVGGLHGLAAAKTHSQNRRNGGGPEMTVDSARNTHGTWTRKAVGEAGYSS